MEQQTISISKAGIVATLQARCSVIAAANPINGHYDGTLNFIENVDLTDPILSRFDILAIVRDTVDPIRDEAVAKWVVDNHDQYHPESEYQEREKNENRNISRPESLSSELLKKYVIYAKYHCKPKLHNIDKSKIIKFYAQLRNKSMSGSGIPIAVRHIESILRMAEANAKMHLRDSVVDEDVNISIRVLLLSFIATQKTSVKTTLLKEFNPYLTFKHDNVEILMHILQNLVVDRAQQTESNKIDVSIKSLKIKAKRHNINDVGILLTTKRFQEAGYTFDPFSKTIYRQFQ